MGGLIRKLWRNRTAAVGMVLVTIAVFVALTCQWIAPYASHVQFRPYAAVEPGMAVVEVSADNAEEGLKPGDRFWLGTDKHARDVLSRVFYGARISLIVGVLAGAFAVLGRFVVGAFGIPVRLHMPTVMRAAA